MNSNLPYVISGNNLAEIRKLRGMTQKDLAKAAYTNQQTISELESGNRNPSLLLAYSISCALKVSIYSIWQLKYIDSPLKLKMYEEDRRK